MAYKYLKNFALANSYLCQLQMWGVVWNEQKVKSKLMKVLDAESLLKRVRIAQDTIGASLGHADVIGMGEMQTIYDFVYKHLIGIPHDVVVEGQIIGTRAFGVVREYKMKGLSFLLEHINYCGRLHKKDVSLKFESFYAEQGMQVLHPSIV